MTISLNKSNIFYLVAALLASFVAFMKNVDYLITSDLLIFVYVIIGAFWLECVFLILIFGFRKQLGVFFYEAYQILKNVVSAPSNLLDVRIIVSVVLCFALAGFGTYQAGYYYLGKKVRLDNYSIVLVEKSDKAYMLGDFTAAKKYLTACHSILGSVWCQRILNRLNQRTEVAERIYNIYQDSPAVTQIKLRMLADILLLTRNKQNYDNEVAAIKNRHDIQKTNYHAAIVTLKEGSLVSALPLLRDVQKNIPTLGDVHLLIEEVEAKLEGRNRTFPYLQAIAGSPAERFVAYTVKLPAYHDAGSILTNGYNMYHDGYY